LSTGHLWDWVPEPCARCAERELTTGSSPILDVPVHFPQGPEELWSEMHRPLCTPCFQAERAIVGKAATCQACPESAVCADGKPVFKGTCAAVATSV
jgi:hypothetical protein